MGFISACTTIVVGTLAVRRYFVPERHAQILSPPHQSENGGRKLTVAGSVPRRRRRSIYWIAVQPSDCRDEDLWWPQHKELTFERDGSWTLPGVTLGREHADGGADDVGIIYTIGLLEVPGAARDKFRDDKPIVRPPECRILHTIDVRRVRY